MKETRIIIAGGRDFNDYHTLASSVDQIIEREISAKDKENIVIISGSARGAEKLGEQYAFIHGYRSIIALLEWDKYGEAAGPIRNKTMAVYATTDNSRGILLAFWDGKSIGTKNMIDTAYIYGMQVYVVRYEE